MNTRGLQIALLTVFCLLVIVSCATTKDLRADEPQKAAEVQRDDPSVATPEEELTPGQTGLMPDGEFTERPAAGLDIDRLLQDPGGKHWQCNPHGTSRRRWNCGLLAHSRT